jgi:hypothetical protein
LSEKRERNHEVLLEQRKTKGEEDKGKEVEKR